jgi:hypothetical protein
VNHSVAAGAEAGAGVVLRPEQAAVTLIKKKNVKRKTQNGDSSPFSVFRFTFNVLAFYVLRFKF